MKKLSIIICIALISCNTAKQLERTVAKVERYKKALGIKPCDCVTIWPENTEWPNDGIQRSLPYYPDQGFYKTSPQFPLFFTDSIKIDSSWTHPIKIIYE